MEAIFGSEHNLTLLQECAKLVALFCPNHVLMKNVEGLGT